MGLTSKKPDMKFDGNLWSPLKFSSLKYDMTWFDCFQKFMVSCRRRSARLSPSSPPSHTNRGVILPGIPRRS